MRGSPKLKGTHTEFSTVHFELKFEKSVIFKLDIRLVFYNFLIKNFDFISGN